MRIFQHIKMKIIAPSLAESVPMDIFSLNNLLKNRIK